MAPIVKDFGMLRKLKRCFAEESAVRVCQRIDMGESLLCGSS